MYRAFIRITGISPYSQARMHQTPKNDDDGETWDDHDKRTWREKCHYDKNGNVFVPAMGLKMASDEAAKRLAIPDPDNRRATMTKFFVSEVLCEDHMLIGVKLSDMVPVTISANSDGRRGSGKRVPRTLPHAPEWGGVAQFLVMNEKIKPELLERVLSTAGVAVGVGQFAPRVGGSNGRFQAKLVKWSDVSWCDVKSGFHPVPPSDGNAGDCDRQRGSGVKLGSNHCGTCSGTVISRTALSSSMVNAYGRRSRY